MGARVGGRPAGSTLDPTSASCYPRFAQCLGKVDMPSGFPRRFGKYLLLKPLAQGGMGALYLAVSGERGLEKLCALKTVLPHLADKEYLGRFRDEAKVVVKLQHGNLVTV